MSQNELFTDPNAPQKEGSAVQPEETELSQPIEGTELPEQSEAEAETDEKVEFGPFEVEKEEKKPQKRLRNIFFFPKLSVKTICYCAVLVALSVIGNIFTVYMNFAGSNALAFTYTVNFIAGAMLGPFAGFIVGACGDLLGWLINPSGGSFNPLLVLTSGLLGLLPGVVFLVAKKLFPDQKKRDKLLPVWTVISFILVWLICTNLNTVIVFYFYISGISKKYTALGAYYVYRIPFQTLFWTINLGISLALIYPLKKILKM